MYVCTRFLTKHTGVLKVPMSSQKSSTELLLHLQALCWISCWTLSFFFKHMHSKQRSMCSASVFKTDLPLRGSAAPLRLHVDSEEIDLKLFLMFQRSYSMLVKVYIYESVDPLMYYAGYFFILLPYSFSYWHWPKESFFKPTVLFDATFCHQGRIFFLI